MASIQKTLYAKGTPDTAFNCTLCTYAPLAGTEAALKDGNDATRALARWAGDSIDVDSGDYREDWDVDDCPSFDGIVQIVIRARCRKINVAGSDAAWIEARVDGVTRGTKFALTGTMGWRSWTFTNDPADFQSWTYQKLRAQTFGFFISQTMTNPNNETHIEVAEFEILVYATGWEIEDPPAATAEAGKFAPVIAISAPDAIAQPGKFSPVIAISAPDATAAPSKLAQVVAIKAPEASAEPGVAAAGENIPDTFQQDRVVPHITIISPMISRLAPTSPAYLGNLSFGDISIKEGPKDTDPSVFDQIKASTFEDLEADFGKIAGLRFFAAGFFTSLFPAIGEYTSDAKIRYTTVTGTGEADANAAVEGQQFSPPRENWRMALAPGGLDFKGSWRVIGTALVATRPGGGLWTKADVDSLSDVTPVITVSGVLNELWNVPTELWIEVHRQIGDTVDTRHRTILDHTRLKARMGDNTLVLSGGDIRIKLKTARKDTRI